VARTVALFLNIINSGIGFVFPVTLEQKLMSERSGAVFLTQIGVLRGSVKSP